MAAQLAITWMMIAPDMLTAIATYLPVTSIMRLSSTCATFHAVLLADARLWAVLCRRDFHLLPPSTSPRDAASWRSFYRRMFDPIVLTWGVIQGGRLRQDGAAWRNTVVPTPIDTSDLGPIKAISSAGFGMHVLTQHGHVWLWGRLDEHSPVTRGTKVPLVERAVAISSGHTCGVAITARGNAYVWVHRPSSRGLHVVQCNVDGPTLRRCRVRQIAAGWNHVAILFDDGRVKTCALADLDAVHLQPSFADADPMVALAAGHMFTAARTASGRVRFWRHIGKCPSVDTILSHAALNLDDDLFCRHISAGLNQFCVCDARTGTLTMLRVHNTLPPTAATASFSATAVHDIVHGTAHAGALLENGQVWTWGNGSSALGLGIDDENHPVRQPTRVVRGLDNRGLFVLELAGGGWQSAALAVRV
ncbi:Aste57867_9820 [Aphanomyces stellatus]|uniref:Aste57867_9820 protein n=1 Tax=Aphanomyces stellatus TaxID=120398 RepID=A0A485KPE9_9STRA|nr:hypothetical protein As57867_009781 [Aphanomyces stellatus]VFT86699.1 Aste57867_9820 [Aphanomyces stellatus]